MTTKKRETIFVNSYLPTKPTFFNENDRGDLDTTLRTDAYNRMVNDPDDFFTKAQITNFDLIHNRCRGDELSFSKRYYETILKTESEKSFLLNSHKEEFISSAIRSDRNDVHLEKDLLFENIKRTSLKEDLLSRNIFLSAMDKRRQKKYTDDFKILKF